MQEHYHLAAWGVSESSLTGFRTECIHSGQDPGKEFTPHAEFTG